MDESRSLGLAPRRRALVREVALHCDGRPLVLARSVIPPEALCGVQCRLAHLGERPLGELLFAYRKLRRESLELAKVGPVDWRQAPAAGVEPVGEVWGRRSLYTVARGHVLVCEFFLPAVLSLTPALSALTRPSATLSNGEREVGGGASRVSIDPEKQE